MFRKPIALAAAVQLLQLTVRDRTQLAYHCFGQMKTLLDLLKPLTGYRVDNGYAQCLAGVRAFHVLVGQAQLDLHLSFPSGQLDHLAIVFHKCLSDAHYVMKGQHIYLLDTSHPPQSQLKQPPRSAPVNISVFCTLARLSSGNQPCTCHNVECARLSQREVKMLHLTGSISTLAIVGSLVSQLWDLEIDAAGLDDTFDWKSESLLSLPFADVVKIGLLESTT